jgi:FkbM family methyltransferase
VSFAAGVLLSKQQTIAQTSIVTIASANLAPPRFSDRPHYSSSVRLPPPRATPMALRTIIRDSLPQRYGVPLRYAFNAAVGQLDLELKLIGTDFLPLRRRAIDIGANYGLYTYALARHASRVEAFDPVPGCAAFIRGWQNPKVRVHQTALSDREGESILHIPLLAGRPAPALASLAEAVGEHEHLVVHLTTLDRFAFDDVDVIKIDVEGYELSVLQGAVKTLRRCRPALIIEIEQRHLDRVGQRMETIFEFLDGFGYAAFFVDATHEPRIRPITEFSYERHQRSQLASVDSVSYIKNFTFVRRSETSDQ